MCPEVCAHVLGNVLDTEISADLVEICMKGLVTRKQDLGQAATDQLAQQT